MYSWTIFVQTLFVHLDPICTVRESVRPTVRPVLLRRKANIVLSATTSTLFIATTKVAAFGRGTSFVVSFVVAMNRVDVVAADTIFVLRLSKSGRTVGRTGSRLDGWSVGRTIGPKSEKNYQS